MTGKAGWGLAQRRQPAVLPAARRVRGPARGWALPPQ